MQNLLFQSKKFRYFITAIYGVVGAIALMRGKYIEAATWFLMGPVFSWGGQDNSKRIRMLVWGLFIAGAAILIYFEANN